MFYASQMAIHDRELREKLLGARSWGTRLDKLRSSLELEQSTQSEWVITSSVPKRTAECQISPETNFGELRYSLLFAAELIAKDVETMAVSERENQLSLAAIKEAERDLTVSSA